MMILDSIHEVVKKEIRVGHIVVRSLQDTNVDLREGNILYEFDRCFFIY